MTTNQTLDPEATCYECGQPFSAEEQDSRHDQHPDWCLVEHGDWCDCVETYPVHTRCCFACNGPLFPDRHASERGHRFFPRQTVLDQIPSLYKTEKQPIGERMVHLHFFTSSADFWVIELESSTGTAFGYVCLGDPSSAEWGGFYLPELQDVCVPLRFEEPCFITPPVIVERDLHWIPKPAKECNLPGRGVNL